MIRIIVLFFAFLISISGQESGLQLTIGTEQITLGIDGVPRKLAVIAVTISNPGDVPQSLVVGKDYNNADHWDVSVYLMNRDGTIILSRRVPRAVLITGNVGNVVIAIPAHGSYKTLLDARDFEFVYPSSGTTNLAGFINAPGEQIQVMLYCGDVHPVPGAPVDPKAWKGILVSDWLKPENSDPNR